MALIDTHVHLYPPEVNADPVGWAAAQGELHWATLSTRRRRDGRLVQGFPTVATLLHDMDAAGVDRAVLLGWYWQNPATCWRQNRFFADCVRAHGDRLSAFAGWHPAAGEQVMAEELRRARDGGLTGLGELCPPAQGYAMDDPGLALVLEQAAAWRWPVNFHVTDPLTGPYPGRVETPRAEFEQLVSRHPRTSFILAHWAARWPLTEFPNVWVDTAASPLLYPPAIWSDVGPRVPAAKVLFGSDYPLCLYPRSGRGPDMASFMDEARSHLRDATVAAAVLGENARGLLAQAGRSWGKQDPGNT